MIRQGDLVSALGVIEKHLSFYFLVPQELSKFYEQLIVELTRRANGRSTEMQLKALSHARKALHICERIGHGAFGLKNALLTLIYPEGQCNSPVDQRWSISRRDELAVRVRLTIITKLITDRELGQQDADSPAARVFSRPKIYQTKMDRLLRFVGYYSAAMDIPGRELADSIIRFDRLAKRSSTDANNSNGECQGFMSHFFSLPRERVQWPFEYDVSHNFAFDCVFDDALMRFGDIQGMLLEYLQYRGLFPTDNRAFQKTAALFNAWRDHQITNSGDLLAAVAREFGPHVDNRLLFLIYQMQFYECLEKGYNEQAVQLLQQRLGQLSDAFEGGDAFIKSMTRNLIIPSERIPRPEIGEIIPRLAIECLNIGRTGMPLLVRYLDTFKDSMRLHKDFLLNSPIQLRKYGIHLVDKSIFTDAELDQNWVHSMHQGGSNSRRVPAPWSGDAWPYDQQCPTESASERGDSDDAKPGEHREPSTDLQTRSTAELDSRPIPPATGTHNASASPPVAAISRLFSPEHAVSSQGENEQQQIARARRALLQQGLRVNSRHRDGRDDPGSYRDSSVAGRTTSERSAPTSPTFNWRVMGRLAGALMADRNEGRGRNEQGTSSAAVEPDSAAGGLRRSVPFGASAQEYGARHSQSDDESTASEEHEMRSEPNEAMYGDAGLRAPNEEDDDGDDEEGGESDGGHSSSAISDSAAIPAHSQIPIDDSSVEIVMDMLAVSRTEAREILRQHGGILANLFSRVFS